MITAKAAPGDFVAVCVNYALDLWMLFPVEESDERGVVQVVTTPNGSAQLNDIMAAHTKQRVAAEYLTDIKAVQRRCHKAFWGRASLTKALEPYRDAKRFDAMVAREQAA